GELIYSRCFGLANMEHNIPVSETTCFHVASVSKQVTILSLMLLVEEGKISLDDDVRNYLPDLINFSEPVTIRQMMNNISGIRDQWELMTMKGIRYIDTISTTDVLETLRTQKTLNFAPGSKYLYSNTNFTMISEIVKRITGTELPEFAKKRIFEPLGMDMTFIRKGLWDIVPGIAYSYTDNGNGLFEPSPLNFQTWGATSMNTTAWDLLKLLQHYEEPTICSKESIEIMKTNALLNDGTLSGYGGGLFIGEYKGHKYFQHSGADAAFRAQVYSFHDDHLQIAITTNTANTPLGAAAQKIADIVLDLPETPAYPLPECRITSPSAGVYASIDVFANVYENDGKWYASMMAHNPVPLIPDENGGFNLGYLDYRAYFTNEGIMFGQFGTYGLLKKISPAEAHDRKDLLGTYDCIDLEMPLWVIEHEGILCLRHFRFGTRPLYKIDSDIGDRYIYYLDDEMNLDIIFNRNDNGSVQSFSMSCSRCLDMVCTKQ
ncbi:MAG: beta-lactamase family protein, partial [Clostridia bacterium]|nr:beta-lactamase family protein [Clostridia bacterium]